MGTLLCQFGEGIMFSGCLPVYSYIRLLIQTDIVTTISRESPKQFW